MLRTSLPQLLKTQALVLTASRIIGAVTAVAHVIARQIQKSRAIPEYELVARPVWMLTQTTQMHAGGCPPREIDEPVTALYQWPCFANDNPDGGSWVAPDKGEGGRAKLIIVETSWIEGWAEYPQLTLCQRGLRCR